MTVHDLFRHTSGLTYGPFGDSLVQRHVSRQATCWTASRPMRRWSPSWPPCRCSASRGRRSNTACRPTCWVASSKWWLARPSTTSSPTAWRARWACMRRAFALIERDGAGLALPRRHAGAPKACLFDYDAAHPPKWHSGGAGLLSTAGDYARFCQMLLNGGVLDGVRVLSRSSVALMLSDHLPADSGYGGSTTGLGHQRADARARTGLRVRRRRAQGPRFESQCPARSATSSGAARWAPISGPIRASS